MPRTRSASGSTWWTLTYAPVPDIGLADIKAICRANVVAALAITQEAGRQILTPVLRAMSASQRWPVPVRCTGVAVGARLELCIRRGSANGPLSAHFCGRAAGGAGTRN